jgi:hypothetical protein
MHEFLSAYGLVELSARTFQYYVSASAERVGKTETGCPFVVIHVDDNDIDMSDAGTADRPVKAEL